MSQKRVIEFIANCLTEIDGVRRNFKIGDIVELDYDLIIDRGFVGWGQARFRPDMELKVTEITGAAEPETAESAPVIPEAEKTEQHTSRLKTKWLNLREACALLKWPYNSTSINALKEAIISKRVIGAMREGARTVYQVDAEDVVRWAKAREKELKRNG